MPFGNLESSTYFFPLTLELKLVYFNYMKRFITCIAAACLGLILAAIILPGFQVAGDFRHCARVLLLAGVILGLINFFIKPIVGLIILPLNIITLGLLGLILNIATVWAVDVLFGNEIVIVGLFNLFITSLLVSAANMLIAPSHKD